MLNHIQTVILPSTCDSAFHPYGEATKQTLKPKIETLGFLIRWKWWANDFYRIYRLCLRFFQIPLSILSVEFWKSGKWQIDKNRSLNTSVISWITLMGTIVFPIKIMKSVSQSICHELYWFSILYLFIYPSYRVSVLKDAISMPTLLCSKSFGFVFDFLLFNWFGFVLFCFCSKSIQSMNIDSSIHRFIYSSIHLYSWTTNGEQCN